MTDLNRFRAAMAKHLGGELTPAVAAQIEAQAFTQPDQSIDPAQFAPQDYHGIVFAAESFRAILAELHPQHEAHFAETERARAGQVLNMDYDYIAFKELRGELLQFTARMNGELVGNVRMYLFKDVHTSTLGANEDTLYLCPKARVGLTASRFLDYVERCLKAVGVQDVWLDTKILHDETGKVIRDVGVLLKRKGCEHVANRFHKTLTKE